MSFTKILLGNHVDAFHKYLCLSKMKRYLTEEGEREGEGGGGGGGKNGLGFPYN